VVDAHLRFIYIRARAAEVQWLSRFHNLTRERFAVKPQYEIFEQSPGGPVLRAVIPGLFNARLKLSELAEITTNECYALYPPTKEIVARVNASNAA
jgi:hypothetical protein